MNYLDFLEKNVFSGRVENQSVLELGALNSKITNVIGRCNPNSIYTVDPESSGKPDFRGTANDFYAADHFTEPYDVVVCMGLLYHLHSPWHLIELIINHSRPKILILETAHSIRHSAGVTVDYEEHNTFGNAYADKEIKYPIKRRSAVIKEDWVDGIQTTPLKLEQLWDYNEMDGFFEQDKFFTQSKRNMWMGVFKWENRYVGGQLRYRMAK